MANVLKSNDDELATARLAEIGKYVIDGNVYTKSAAMFSGLMDNDNYLLLDGARVTKRDRRNHHRRSRYKEKKDSEKVFIVISGPQGAGKGTQSEKIGAKYGINSLSTGDVFRRHLKEGTELGILAQSYMSKGELVPTDVTNRMLLEELGKREYKKGAIIDGYPREPLQVDGLNELVRWGDLHYVDAFVCLDPSIDSDLSGQYKEFPASAENKPAVKIPEEYATLVERSLKRLSCRAGGHSYSTDDGLSAGGKCAQDGSELYVRDDDKAETLGRRLNEYAEKTRPAIRRVKKENPGKFIEVNPYQSKDQVWAQIEAGLDRIIQRY